MYYSQLRLLFFPSSSFQVFYLLKYGAIGSLLRAGVLMTSSGCMGFLGCADRALSSVEPCISPWNEAITGVELRLESSLLRARIYRTPLMQPSLGSAGEITAKVAKLTPYFCGTALRH
jgi:homoaconitase/3-isopropylmalate dehydratase large subunit